MIEEVAFFLRHGPNVGRKQTSMGKVEFQNWLTTRVDEDGMAAPRAALVEGLHGEVVEIGCGSGAMFQYYSRDVRATAIEPDDEFRESAEQAAHDAVAKIRVIPGFAESLTMPDDSVDAIICSSVLCSIDSISKTLGEFKRVLKPGGSLRLLEHVRSEHWMAGPLMSLTNRLWLRINKVGCNWHRHVEEPVRGAGFRIASVERIKFYSTAAPATFPTFSSRPRSKGRGRFCAAESNHRQTARTRQFETHTFDPVAPVTHPLRRRLILILKSRLFLQRFQGTVYL